MDTDVRRSLLRACTVKPDITHEQAREYSDAKRLIFNHAVLQRHVDSGYVAEIGRTFLQIYEFKKLGHSGQGPVYVLLEDIGETFVLYFYEYYDDIMKVVNRAWATTSWADVTARFDQIMAARGVISSDKDRNHQIIIRK